MIRGFLLPCICSWRINRSDVLLGLQKISPVKIRSSFIPMDFVVLEMDVCRLIPLILGRPFLSTTGATIDVAPRILKLNINGREETFTSKLKGIE
jgi:hypothetical protein